MLGILTLVAFYIGYSKFGLEVGRTMAFVSLGMLELVHVFNLRTEESIFKIDLFSNKYLIGSFLLGLILQISVVIIPQFATIFEVQNLTKEQWLYTAIISIMPIVIMEFQKWCNGVMYPERYSKKLPKEIESSKWGGKVLKEKY